jgi:membrane-bound lytic murein transglycosylase D
MSRRIAGLWLGALFAAPAFAQTASPPTEPPAITLPDTPTGEASRPDPAAGTRNGRDIYQRFRDGLADRKCATDASTRWRQHFATAPKRLAARNDDVLPLFGYVVDALREAHLPTEYALIPFVESGYKPGARSPQGPAGLWQMIAVTARNHKVAIRPGYDGRLSAVDSTAAAVRYLKTLHGMFAGDWRLAVMAYNAGEYRVLGALKRGGQVARNARPEQLPGLSPITQAYVRKLHALSCLMEQADDREEWLRALDRPVPRLEAVTVPDGIADIAEWAKRTGQDAAQLQRLNPAFAGGRLVRASGRPARLLAVAGTTEDSQVAAIGAIDITATKEDPAGNSPSETPMATAAASVTAATATEPPLTATASATMVAAGATLRHHTVARGDNASTIAKRYGVRLADLLRRNDLTAESVLRPGKVLEIDALAQAETVPDKTVAP